VPPVAPPSGPPGLDEGLVEPVDAAGAVPDDLAVRLEECSWRKVLLMPQMSKVDAAIRRDHHGGMKMREVERKYNVS
ncbi:hypothetical protein, partial [Streptomyces sp. NPDC000188]|uniref:hypothetical protein n=1 Tax=Streptomyces sp. NPDC000188 TaxID=3154245 RepID=UPI003316EBBA